MKTLLLFLALSAPCFAFESPTEEFEARRNFAICATNLDVCNQRIELYRMLLEAQNDFITALHEQRDDAFEQLDRCNEYRKTQQK